MTTPLAYNLRTAAEAVGMSQDKLRQEIGRGALKARKSDRDEDGNPCGRFVIRHADLEAWLDGLEAA